MGKMITAKKALQTAMIIGSFSVANSHASNWDELPQDSSEVNYTEGHIGTATGALSGAAIGGPPGLVLGAVIGKFIGRDRGMQRQIDERDQQLQQLQAQLDHQQQAATMRPAADKTNAMQVASLSNVVPETVPDIADIIRDGVAFSIHFRTDSDQIEKHIVEQCRTFAGLSKLFPDLVVSLRGYADPRGASSYNLGLSQRRLATVKQLLIEEGVDAAVIEETARGEDDLLNPGDVRDSFSFERRVDIIFSQREERS